MSDLPPGVRKKGRNIFKVSQEYLKEDLRLLRDNPKISQEKKYNQPIGKPTEIYNKQKNFKNKIYEGYKQENKYKYSKSSTPDRAVNSQKKETAKGYLMGDAYGNRGKMDYEPTPRYGHGGDVAGCGCASCMGESSVRGAGAAIRGTKFSGVK